MFKSLFDSIVAFVCRAAKYIKESICNCTNTPGACTGVVLGGVVTGLGLYQVFKSDDDDEETLVDEVTPAAPAAPAASAAPKVKPATVWARSDLIELRAGSAPLEVKDVLINGVSQGTDGIETPLAPFSQLPIVVSNPDIETITIVTNEREWVVPIAEGVRNDLRRQAESDAEVVDVDTQADAEATA